MTRRIPLNPCDCLIYGHHRRVVSRHEGGNIPFMVVDLDGRIGQSDMKAALSRTMARHPATMANLQTSAFRLRPYWQTPFDPTHGAEHAAACAYVFDDLSCEGEAWQKQDDLWQVRYTPNWDSRLGPQVRLEHYALPAGKTRLCLRWPHYLMDAVGAQWFLTELGRSTERISNGPPHAPLSLPDALLEDSCEVNVLKAHNIVDRLRLLRRGWSATVVPPHAPLQSLANLAAGRLQDYRAIHRHWDAAAVKVIQKNAKLTTPPGPALYARHLAACVLHAVHMLHREQDVPSPAYSTTFPLMVADFVDDPTIFRRRTLIGNYLVSPVIVICADQAEDLRAIGDSLLTQLSAFRASAGGLAQWALLWWASLIHVRTYGLLFKLPLAVHHFATGFSYFRWILEPLRSIAGARVTNIWAGGPTTIPPGWNPVFSLFEDSLNLSLTYTRPAISDDLAHRYVELIEAEALGSA